MLIPGARSLLPLIIMVGLPAGACGGSGSGNADVAGPTPADASTAETTGAGTDLAADSLDGPAEAAPGIDAGPPSAVKGRFWQRMIDSEGMMAERPVDLSRYHRIGVWTGAGSQRRFLPGSGDTQGNILVPDVPGGPFLLELASSPTFARVLHSPGATREFSLGFQELRRAPAVRPQAGPGTSLFFTLSNLDPWKPGDLLGSVHETGSSTLLGGSLFTAGATTTTARVSFSGQSHLDGPGLGDSVWLIQERDTSAPLGLTISKPVRAVSSRALKTIEGQETPVPLTMMPVLETDAISIDVRRSEFTAFQDAAGPGARLPTVTVAVHRSPAPLETTETGTATNVLTVRAPEGPGEVKLDTTTGDPFPADRIKLASVTISFPIPLQLAGVMPPDDTFASIRLVDRADRLLAGPVRPQLSPPVDLRIEGLPARRALAQVGTTPTISWGPPPVVPAGISQPDGGILFLGPELYEVSIRKLEPRQDGVDEVTRLIVTTEDLSVQVPPDLLERGAWYTVVVNATVTRHSRLSAPQLRGLPQYEAATVSAPFTP